MVSVHSYLSSAFLYTVKGSVSTEFNGRVDSIKAIELLLLLFITHKLDVKHVKIKKLFTGAVICSWFRYVSIYTSH